jgi:hypothetical protein
VAAAACDDGCFESTYVSTLDAPPQRAAHCLTDRRAALIRVQGGEGECSSADPSCN